MKNIKVLKRIGLGFFLIFMSVLLLLTTTPQGSFFIIKNIVRIVPNLKIANMQYQDKDFIFQDIVYQTERTTLNIDQLTLQLPILSFNFFTPTINKISINNIAVQIDTIPEKKSSKATSISLYPLYPMAIKHFFVDQLELTINQKVALNIKKINTGIAWKQGKLNFTDLNINMVGLNNLHTQSIKRNNNGTTNNIAALTFADNAENIIKQLQQTLTSFTSSTLAMPFKLEILELAINKFAFTNFSEIPLAFKTFTHIHLTRLTIAENIALKRIHAQFSDGDLDISGNFFFTPKPQLNLNIISNLAIANQPKQRAHIKLSCANLTKKIEINGILSGWLNGKLNTTLDLNKRNAPLVISFSSTQQPSTLPFSPFLPYSARNIDILLKGNIKNYQLYTAAHVFHENGTQAKIILDGQGNHHQFTVTEMNIREATPQKGNANAKIAGVISWQKEINWRAKLSVIDVNMAKYFTMAPETLNGYANIHGTIMQNSKTLHVEEIDIIGKLNDQPLKLHGAFSLNNSAQLIIPSFSLNLGKNYLKVKGHIKENWHLFSEIKAQNLSQIYPQLSGKIQGKIELTGTEKQPKIVTQLTATTLKWHDIAISNMQLASSINNIKNISGHLKLTSDQITYKHQSIDQFSFKLTGNEENHQIMFLTKTDKKENINTATISSANIVAAGAFNRKTTRWQAAINKANFNTLFGNWKNEIPINIEYHHKKNNVNTTAHCWIASNSKICFSDGENNDNQSKLNIAINAFDLALLSPIFPSKTEIIGNLNGTATLNWAQNKQNPIFKLLLQTKKINLKSIVTGNNRPPQVFTNLQLQTTIKNKALQLNWSLDAARKKQIVGAIQVNQVFDKNKLSGSIIFNHLSLDFINLLDPDTNSVNFSAFIAGELTLAGTVMQPLLMGQLNILELAIKNKSLPFTIQTGELKGMFSGKLATLDGNIVTPGGKLALSGKASWSNIHDWSSTILMQSNNIMLNFPNFGKLETDAMLTFDASPAALKLMGKAAISSARIQLESLSKKAIQVSSYEVIIDETGQPLVEEAIIAPIEIDIDLLLGDDVKFSGYDLTAVGNGELKWRYSNDNNGVYGKVNLVSGKFTGYNQDLIVEKGDLTFLGESTPYLNIVAMRNMHRVSKSSINNAEEKRVYLSITGELYAPQINISSEAMISDQEAMSMLLTGGRYFGENAKNQKYEFLGTVLTSNPFITKSLEQFGKLTGLKNLTLSYSSDSVKNKDKDAAGTFELGAELTKKLYLQYRLYPENKRLSDIMLSYQLSPKIYVETEIETDIGKTENTIFDNVLFRLRYQLFKKLFFEIETTGGSKYSTFGLFYQFEF